MYRLLDIGETILESDEYFGGAMWHSCTSIAGKIVEPLLKPVRRQIEIQSVVKKDCDARTVTGSENLVGRIGEMNIMVSDFIPENTFIVNQKTFDRIKTAFLEAPCDVKESNKQ